jgi:periplasmic copper chaperone A
MKRFLPRTLPLSLLALACLMALASCTSRDSVYVDHVWVKLGATPDSPAAAYFTLYGGRADDTLFAVRADDAARAEMHQTMDMQTAHGQSMSEMKPMANVLVPAHTNVKFAPGSYHVMLFSIDKKVKPGSKMHMIFSFTSNLQLEDTATVVGAGDSEPQTH